MGYARPTNQQKIDFINKVESYARANQVGHYTALQRLGLSKSKYHCYKKYLEKKGVISPSPIQKQISRELNQQEVNGSSVLFELLEFQLRQALQTLTKITGGM